MTAYKCLVGVAVIVGWSPALSSAGDDGREPAARLEELAGRYEFFGEFNPKSARGAIIAK